MSRLIIKNLPKKISEEKIREIFSEKGTITDVQLKYTAEGTFRRFAFIGYQTEDEANNAVETFNQMFINTSKISVEKCALLGDSNKPKAWSKYAPDSSAYKKVNTPKDIVPEKKEKKKKKQEKTDQSAELLEKYKDDPLFEEFLQLNAPKEHEKLQNLEKEKLAKEDEDSAIESQSDEEQTEKLANKDISDLDYMKTLMGKPLETEDAPKRKAMEKQAKEKKELFTLKLKDLPYNFKKKDVKQIFKDNKPFSIRVPRKIHGFAYVGFKTEKAMKKALMKDKTFINGKQISIMKFDYKEDDSNINQKNVDPKKYKWRNQEEALQNEESIAESGRIFIRNLSYTTTEADIEELFKKFGLLSEVNLPVDQTTRKLKGFGLITFLMPEHAVRAYSELDGTVFHGRMLHLLPGKVKDEANEEDLEESSNFKAKKSAKQKSQAGSSHNWNALFLGQDAVAEVVADTFGTTKEAVVGPSGEGSAAVRLALGETQIVAQTRKYLEQEGVILDAFKTGTSNRSKTVILVKNLPSKTPAKEINELFKKHGELGRVILPPSGITAVVEFLEPSEARKAFTKLAYSKFKNVPLYLEWAPENSLGERKISATEVKESLNDETNGETTVREVKDENKEDEEENDDEPEPDTTLYVKNLNFKTTDESLKEHFKKCGAISYAYVARKKDNSNPDNKLSMGYGFIRFMLKASADKALKTLQQSVLDEKSLELKRSERTLQNEVTNKRKTVKSTKQNGTKLLVRNVPFQANTNEIQELFSTFGEIKALRLPRKMSGSDSHRGFAFVDYVTAADAKSAFDALSQSTHLYGRRLVLEWASEDDRVEVLRKRTADHFKATEEVKSKKSVFSLE